MIEATTEMASAAWDALPVTVRESGEVDLDDMKAVCAAVLPLVEEALLEEEPEEPCGVVYVDPRGAGQPSQAPCGKRRGHENGPETDWKRGYHSNGMFKWPVEQPVASVVRQIALNAIAARNIRPAEAALLACRQGGDHVLVHVNIYGNALAVEAALRWAGYRTVDGGPCVLLVFGNGGR